jgi:hypothetical protein
VEGKSGGKDHLGDLGIDGRIILSWILNRMRRALIVSVTQDRDMAGSCELSDELLGSIKYRELFDQLRN